MSCLLPHCCLMASDRNTVSWLLISGNSRGAGINRIISYFLESCGDHRHPRIKRPNIDGALGLELWW